MLTCTQAMYFSDRVYLRWGRMANGIREMHLIATLFLVVLVLVNHTTANPVKITVRLEEAGTETAPEGEDCTACAQLKQAMEQPLSQEEIRQARIEQIKSQILQKLRMSARPNVTQPIKNLPEPLLRKHGGLFDHNGAWQGDRTEEYYAETREVISFADPVAYCDNTNTSVCFSIRLKHSINSGEIKSAKLYTKNILPGSRMTIHSTSPAKSNAKFIDSKSSSRDSWISFNLRRTMLNIIENSVSPKVHLKLTCTECGRNTVLSTVKENLPFLELHTDEGPERNRRRVHRCNGDGRCCKESLYVSFTEIGWNDWIHSPEGYWANYCSGSCADLHDIPAYQHSRVLFSLSDQGRTARARLSLCCVPTKLSKLSLLYQDEDGEILKKDLPNMSVDSCGCA